MRAQLVVAIVALASSTGLAQQSDKPIRLASPGFTGVNVDEKVASFLSDHFAQRLALEGISIITPNEVAALVGLERQRQLMGCTEDSASCVAELADALGADGVVTGSIGKFGETFQVNIKILGSSNAKALAIISKRAYGEEDLLEVLNSAAEIAAIDLRQRLRPGTAAPERQEEPEPEEEAATPTSSATTPTQTSAMQRPNAISAWVLGALIGVYAIEYERLVSPNLGVYLQPALVGYSASVEGTEYGFAGFDVTAGARLYPGGNGSGFFVGAELKGNSGVVPSGASSSGIAAAGTLGLSARLAEWFVISLGGGLGYYFVGQGTFGGQLDMSLRGHVGLAF